MPTATLEIDSFSNKADQILGQQDLLEFTKCTFPGYKVNWHHKIIADKLTDVVNGKIKRLMIFMPPRHGKSELVSRRMPAFFLGKNPDKDIILTSYSAELANKMNVNVQGIIDSEKFLKIFPNIRLGGSVLPPPTKVSSQSPRQGNEFGIVDYRGGLVSAGVAGSIIGMGGDILLIDDAIKNYQESRSPAILEATWNWYGSTLNNRLQPDGAIVLIMHRWGEGDLPGRILDLADSDPDADQFEVIRFPAICDERNPYDPRQIGEALWPEAYDLKRLKAIRANNPRSFEALFQQRPGAEEGDLLKRKNMKNFYTRLLNGRCDKMIQSWDCAFKGDESHDYVVGQVWGVWGKNFYLIHEVRAHMTFTETIRAIVLLSANYPEARIKLIEDKANGPAIIESAKRQLHGLVPFPGKGKPLGSKESRVKSISHIWEGQNVYLPSPSIASWIEDFISELANFPNGKRDDRVDAMSQAFIYLDQSNIGWINRFIGN